MKDLRDLQRKVDARRGDESALGRLADDITAAVRRYKRQPTLRNYRSIALAVVALRGVEKAREPR